MVRNNGRTRPWTDVERQLAWLDKDRPLKSLACAGSLQREVQKWPTLYVRDPPAHADCEGTSSRTCSCNCHFEWKVGVDLVRLRDGAVGLVGGQLDLPEYMMMVRLGHGAHRAVDIGEPVLLDQEGD